MSFVYVYVCATVQAQCTGFKMSFVSCRRELQRCSPPESTRTTVVLSRWSDRTLIAPIRHGPGQNLIISECIYIYRGALHEPSLAI